MNLAGRFSLFVGAVLVAAGCSSSSSIRTVEPDGSLAPTSAFDAAGDPDRSRGTGGGTFGTDGPESPIVDSPPDAHRDGAREVPDGGDADAHIAGHACSAGHTCTGNVRCERVCIGPLIYRCSCTEGHFICTGCMAVDGGASDLRGGPVLCGADVAEGHHCDSTGAVCQERGDGPQKLCACGDLGPDRVWICQ